jgi:hypothetical protein
MLDSINLSAMPSNDNHIEKKIAQWEVTRSKGRKRYIWAHVFQMGIIFPVLLFLLFTPFILKNGGEIAGIFIGIIVFVTLGMLVAYLSIKYSWNYFEDWYERWKNEKDGKILNLPGTRETFKKYVWLFITISGFFLFILDLVYFISIFIVGFITDKFVLDFWLFLISFFIILLISASLAIYGVLTTKNPICGHLILNNTHEDKHPDAKGSFFSNVWRILKKQPFICLDCANRYVFEKHGKNVEIVNLGKETE